MASGAAGTVAPVQAELDPTFLRALRLFHSNSKDSIHQLKAMLDEAIQGRTGGGGGQSVGGGSRKPSIAASSSASEKSVTSGSSSSISAREEQRRNFENLKRDLNDLMDTGSGSGGAGAPKRPRLHGSPGFSKSHTPSPSATPTPPTATTATVGRSGDVTGGTVSGNSSAGDGEGVDFGDLEGLNDLTCCVCGDWAQGNGNKLMECHTCQNLYHQECHSPVISDEEAGDPRLVWNCSQCKAPSKPKMQGSSGLKTGMMKPRSGSTSSITAPPIGGSSGGSSTKRSSSSERHTSSSSSYKSSSTTSGSSKGSRSGSSSGSSYSKSGSGGSGSGGGGGSSSAASTSSLNSADKRLQMMKKKAAQKSSGSESDSPKFVMPTFRIVYGKPKK